MDGTKPRGKARGTVATDGTKTHTRQDMETEQRINLHLPNGWSSCTTEELEAIIQAQMAVGPQEQAKEEDGIKNVPWKIECFLRLADLEKIDGPQPAVPVEEQYITVRRVRNRRTRWFSWWRHGKDEPFVLYVWQIHYWITQNLQWLDALPSIPKFPYPVWKSRFHEFRGPKTFLADWKWAQYRIAQDYLQYYFKTVERVQKQMPQAKTTDEQRKLMKQLNTAKSLFLATIYCGRVKSVNEDTHIKEWDWTYLPNQSTTNSRYFQSFPDIQFQVVLLWWTSTMHRLHTLYPKCFKVDKKKKKKQRPQDPLELYAQMTATLEKYIGTNEQELDKRTCEVVLRHLNNMITENEEMEKIRQKNKTKHS